MLTAVVVQIILMAGLQGVGKTTQCGKLAQLLTKANKKVRSAWVLASMFIYCAGEHLVLMAVQLCLVESKSCLIVVQC